MVAGDYHSSRREGWCRVGVGGKYGYRWTTKDCIIYSLFFHFAQPICPFSHCLISHPTVFSFFLSFFPRLPTLCSLCHPPQLRRPLTPSPSLFLANLKFVRRLRLLDGWPLIFCELHLAQTSLRPRCILLTAALVAGPHHLS